VKVTFEAGVGNGLLAFEQARLAVDGGRSADGAEELPVLVSLLDELTKALRTFEVSHARQAARQDKSNGVGAVDFADREICLDGYAVGTPHVGLDADSDDVRGQTCATKEVNCPNGLDLFEAFGEEDIYVVRHKGTDE
jgi:hypothetical protein